MARPGSWVNCSRGRGDFYVSLKIIYKPGFLDVHTVSFCYFMFLSRVLYKGIMGHWVIY